MVLDAAGNPQMHPAARRRRRSVWRSVEALSAGTPGPVILADPPPRSANAAIAQIRNARAADVEYLEFDALDTGSHRPSLPNPLGPI